MNKAETNNCTWHHSGDFNPQTGTSSKQLVKTDAPKASLPLK